MKRGFGKIPELDNGSWDGFLHKYKKKNVKQKKAESKKKKSRKPLSPPQAPTKIDMELESGEYFLSDNNQSRKTLQEKLEWLDQRFQNGMLKIEKSAESRRKRGEAFMLLKEQESARECVKDDQAAVTFNLKVRGLIPGNSFKGMSDPNLGFSSTGPFHDNNFKEISAPSLVLNSIEVVYGHGTTCFASISNQSGIYMTADGYSWNDKGQLTSCKAQKKCLLSAIASSRLVLVNFFGSVA